MLHLKGTLRPELKILLKQPIRRTICTLVLLLKEHQNKLIQMRSESGTAYDRSDTVNNKSFYEHNLSAQQLQAQEVKEESRSLSVPYGTMVMKEWYFDGIRLKYSDNRYTGYYSFEKKNEMDVVSLGFNLKGRGSPCSTGSAAPGGRWRIPAYRRG